MEVTGWTEDFQSVASATSLSEKTDIFCQPCSGDGQHVKAEGFCPNCKEFMCANCIIYHRKFTQSKHHIVLDKNSMPTNKQQPANVATCTEICEKHSTEFVKFFCKEHEVVGCGDCMILGHKSCKVDYIQDIAQNFVSGSELSSLVKEIKRLITAFKETKEKITRAEEDVATTYEEVVKDVRQFRKEADASLDRMERRLLQQCDQIKKNSDTLIQRSTDDCRAAEDQLNELYEQLTIPGEISTSLFVKVKKITPRIKEMQQELLSADCRSRVQVGKFKRSPSVSNMISNSSLLGEIKTSNICQQHIRTRKPIVDLHPTKMGLIQVKSSADKHECVIVNEVVNEEILACADWGNHKVKLVDIKHSVVKDEISLNGPWDLTCFSGDQLAVTVVFDKQIQFLSFKSGLSKRRAISVQGRCRGIVYSKYRLVVSYEEDPRVEIMTLDGKILQCYRTDNTRDTLFQWPLYVAVSTCSDSSFIYVSDSNEKSVIMLSYDGKVLATYKVKDFNGLRKLVVCKDGSVLVACVSGIHLLSPKCKRLKILLEKKDDIESCRAVCYSDDNNTLYLSESDCNDIKVYQME